MTEDIGKRINNGFVAFTLFCPGRRFVVTKTKVRANAGCSTEYVCDGGGRGPCEKVAKTVREVQCLHVGGSGGIGSSGAGGVVVVAVVVAAAAVWCCWCYFGVYARMYW